MPKSFVFGSARPILCGLWCSVCLAIVAAPYLSSHGRPGLAALMYLFFSPICHQNPGRSFALAGFSWAVCQRCTGIYFGFFAASLLPTYDRWTARIRQTRRILVLIATAPLLLDALLPVIGIWENIPATRFASGFLFGAVISMLLLEGITELLNGSSEARRLPYSPLYEGDNP
jgi:uncharacterized membrane protein